jgi:hypothetical protein
MRRSFAFVVCARTMPLAVGRGHFLCVFARRHGCERLFALLFLQNYAKENRRHQVRRFSERLNRSSPIDEEEGCQAAMRFWARKATWPLSRLRRRSSGEM